MRVNHPVISKWMRGVLLLAFLLILGTYALNVMQRQAAQAQELAKLTHTIGSLQSSVSETTESLSAQASKFESLQNRHSSLQGDYRKLQEKYDSLEQESQRLAQTIAQNEAANVQRQIAQKPIVEFKAPEMKFEPKIEVQRPRKKVVDLIIKSVSVNSKNSRGGNWDASGPPDLMVSVKNDAGESFDTEVIQDQYSGTFNVKSLRITEGDSVTFTVWDSDLLASDEIGSFTKTISADTMQQGTVNWEFGGVASLVLEFQP